MKDADYIDELIGKYLAGEAGPDEAMELENWKSLSPANLDHFNQCARLFEMSSGKKFPQANANKAWEKLKQEQLSEKGKVISMNNRWYWRVAAAVAVLLVLTVAFIYLLPQAEVENLSYSAGDKVHQVDLSDQSNVKIAPHSRIELAKDFGKTNRTVRLKGSAHFTVTHDEKIPFIVDAGKVYIKDIGTAFDVRNASNSDTLSVEVFEGTVLLYDSLGAQITLNAGEQAWYIRSSGRILSNLEETSPTPLHFDFEDSHLGQVIEQLNAAYNTTVVLENPALAQCSITTSFTGQELETILGVITETLGLTYTRTPEGYLIKGETCNH